MTYYAMDSHTNWQRTYGDYNRVTLHTFGTRAARDAWVQENGKHEAITARKAKYVMPYFGSVNQHNK
jgi:hypothetical protein